ncbi:MAG: hypothetical protein LC800_03440 [Acidobacteria bacterium]|nr:hypothetical protein [Acidobacteriota bacterium]
MLAQTADELAHGQLLGLRGRREPQFEPEVVLEARAAPAATITSRSPFAFSATVTRRPETVP